MSNSATLALFFSHLKKVIAPSLCSERVKDAHSYSTLNIIKVINNFLKKIIISMRSYKFNMNYKIPVNVHLATKQCHNVQ